MTGPYATAAEVYWVAGWRGVLPLPAARKLPPPDGWTGHGAPYPSRADLQAWIEEKPNGNVALRLPPELLGIDVDAYGDKVGDRTLAELEAEHGPLPATWISTSRDDGISGIRVFRTPEGLNWRGGGTGDLTDIEIIQPGYRYLVAAPSIHNKTGAEYRWYAPDGGVSEQPPKPGDMPELPLTWVAALVQPRTRAESADLNGEQASSWLRQLRGGDHCPPVAINMGTTIKLLGAPDGGSRHELALASSRALAAFGGEGHAGANDALARLGHAFIAAATSPARGGKLRSADEAKVEYRDLLAGAVRLAAAAHPQPRQFCDCPTDQELYDLVGEAPREAEEEGQERGSSTEEDSSVDPVGRAELDVTNPAVAADWLRDHLGRGQLAGMFQRADDLVYTPREGEDGYLPLTENDRDGDGPAQIRIVTAPGLAAAVSYRYHCTRTTITKNGNETIRPALFPTVAAQTATNALDMMRCLRRLRGVVHTPVVRPDGSVLAAAGYDPHTRLLHLPDPELVVPPIPDNPTSDQTAAAVHLLSRMIAEFPFLTDHDRANFFGALLTPLLRLLTPPPYKLVAIGAPMPASGKSLLAAILRTVHGGVFRSEMPEDDGELRKQVTAILDVTTGPVVQLDNVTGLLTSSTLAGLLTSSRWDDRRLGATEMVSRPNDRLWVLTGNNLNIGGDLPRRTLWITIDPAMPDPHLRTGFAITDLENWVRTRRGEIIAALLTLVRGWAAGGMPRPAADRSDGYTGWITTLRGILGHAGVAGTLDHPDSAPESGGEDEWGTFLDAAHRVFGGEVWTVQELLDRVNVVHSASISLDELPGDLGERASKAGDPRVVAKSLGMWLRNREGRWVNGKAVRKVSGRARAMKWKIATYQAGNGESGESGESGSDPHARRAEDDLGPGGTPPTDQTQTHQTHQTHQAWPDW